MRHPWGKLGCFIWKCKTNPVIIIIAEYWKGKQVTDDNTSNCLTNIINTVTVWSHWTHLMTYVTNNCGQIHSNIKGHHQCNVRCNARSHLTKRSSTWSPFSFLQHNAFLRIEVNASWKTKVVFWNSYWGVWIWKVQLVLKGLEHLTCNPIVTFLCRKQGVLLIKFWIFHKLDAFEHFPTAKQLNKYKGWRWRAWYSSCLTLTS